MRNKATSEIYVLKDENGLVRYVGKSSHSVKKRFSRHLADARDGAVQHKACWIRGMMQRGLLPTCEVIESVAGDGAEAEIKWISFFRQAGVDLTNLTDGGDGTLGHKASAEHRRKMSESIKLSFANRDPWNKGKRMPDDAVRKSAESRRGLRHSAERRATLSRARMGMKFSDEHRAALSRSHSGERHKNYGKHISEATRQKIAAAVALAHREGRCSLPPRDDINGQWKAA